jgi:hypothetical protein
LGTFSSGTDHYPVLREGLKTELETLARERLKGKVAFEALVAISLIAREKPRRLGLLRSGLDSNLRFLSLTALRRVSQHPGESTWAVARRGRIANLKKIGRYYAK